MIFTYLLIHGRYFVLVELMDVARYQMADIHLWFDDSKSFTARQLCGECFWSGLSREEKRLVGSCISHLVNHGQLPLVRTNPHCNGSNKYRITPQPQIPYKFLQTLKPNQPTTI